MGPRPGRGVKEISAELNCPNVVATLTSNYLKRHEKVSQAELDQLSADTFTVVAEDWLNSVGEEYFGEHTNTPYKWPQHADHLIARINDMMLRQWSYHMASRASNRPHRMSTTDDDEEDYDDVIRKRPRISNEVSGIAEVAFQTSRDPPLRYENNDNSYIPTFTRPFATATHHTSFGAGTPGRSAASKAASTITKMTANPFPNADSQESQIEHVAPITLQSLTKQTPVDRTPLLSPATFFKQPTQLPTTTVLKFNGTSIVEVPSMATSILTQSTIDRLQDTVNDMLDVESDVTADQLFDFTRRINDVLLDMQRQARKAQRLIVKDET